MDERSPYYDWRPDEQEERAEAEAEDYCERCERFVSIVGQMACLACGDDPA